MNSRLWQRWTKAEDAELRARVARRETVPAIVVAMRRGEGSIRNRMKDLGLCRLSWTRAEDDRLRAAWGKAPTRELARELHRTTGAVKQRARKLKLDAGRRHTPAQLSIVRRLYQTCTAGEIAERIFGTPRAARAVWRIAVKLGLRKWPHWPPEVIESVRELHAEGLTDIDIGARLTPPLNREQVHHIRYARLRLPPNLEAIKQASQRAVQSQRRTLGIRSLAELRSRAHRSFAAERGWPPGLRLRAVQILELLAVEGRPMGRWEIAEKIGWNMDIARRCQRTLLSSNDAEGSYLANLAARGLIVILPRALMIRGHGRGKSRHLYLLSPAAIDIIIRRSQPCETA